MVQFAQTQQVGNTQVTNRSESGVFSFVAASIEEAAKAGKF